MKIMIWAALTSPYIHIGLISTEIEYDHHTELVEGLAVINLTSPSGQHFVFDAASGVLIGYDNGRVVNDYNRLLGDDPDKGKKKIAERRNTLMQMRREAESHPVDRWTFFQMLHAA